MSTGKDLPKPRPLIYVCWPFILSHPGKTSYLISPSRSLSALLSFTLPIS
ncbi:hypothetical protein E2C01_089494 [Portunus trituberculatus]|uniref:Uncharacterized protein n=1 Tax=Portunus trituberculatus TaxID=210409 RepID=A0A5B7JC62_PORTR|nr:hypothetical protein [Portunus trituberculatus]